MNLKFKIAAISTAILTLLAPNAAFAALTVGATSITTDSTLSLQGGNVGVGDLTPVGALVVGDDTGAGFVNGAGDLYVQNDLEVDGRIIGTNFIWDNVNTRVGIGTQNPIATLDVEDSSTSTTSEVKMQQYIAVLDFGITTSGVDYNYGSLIDMSRSGATGGTVSTRGQSITISSDNAGAGTSSAIGQAITVIGTADTTYGLTVTVPTYATSYAATFSGGNVGIGTTTPAEALDVNSDSIRIRTAQSPATAAACNQGDIAWATDYIYVCVATNDWRRSALSDY